MKWFETRHSPYKQLILLLIALVLILIYYNQSFKNEDYNKLALAFAIFLLLWDATIVIRYVYLSYNYVDEFHKSFINIPYGLKCYFGEPRCENGNFDLFSVFHILGYMVIGYLIPGYYLEILGISVACEFLELAMGFNSKFILDPCINLLGYFLGSKLNEWTK